MVHRLWKSLQLSWKKHGNPFKEGKRIGIFEKVKRGGYQWDLFMYPGWVKNEQRSL